MVSEYKQSQLPYEFNVCLSLSCCIITNMSDVFHMFFLQNLWTFFSLVILIFDVYFKQLVSRKYEAPVYRANQIMPIYARRNTGHINMKKVWRLKREQKNCINECFHQISGKGATKLQVSVILI